ncbi:MAG TPA: signal peptidase I [Candidatus Paceibacterota bacterium]|nr:signal peptidase I [Candidatus Paceibacterota bacterium]
MNDEIRTPDQLSGARNAPHEGTSSFTSMVLYVVGAIVLAVAIRHFIATPYIVIGSSMEPTFYDYHYLIIDRVTYDFENPKRGDVIVLDLPQNTSRALIKRVIGLPGETVVLAGNTVTIKNSEHPDGFTLSEPYLDPADLGGATDMTVTLGPDQFFVLGDNRKVSADSRLWGTLPREDIVGRVLVRLYPFNKLGLFPGEERYAQ